MIPRVFKTMHCGYTWDCLRVCVCNSLLFSSASPVSPLPPYHCPLFATVSYTFSGIRPYLRGLRSFRTLRKRLRLGRTRFHSSGDPSCASADRSVGGPGGSASDGDQCWRTKSRAQCALRAGEAPVHRTADSSLSNHLTSSRARWKVRCERF